MGGCILQVLCTMCIANPWASEGGKIGSEGLA